MSDELSPEILEMLKNSAEDASLDDDEYGMIDDTVAEVDPSTLRPVAPYAPVNLLIKNFQPIEAFFEETPAAFFDDKDYYKKALSGENDSAQRVHTVLSKYLNCQDPKDRTVYRQQMTNAYWELLRSVAPKMTSKNVLMAKRMLMRYGVILPSLFSIENKETFSKAFVENSSNEPIYYLDEWFRDIALGHLPLSATDEAPASRKPAAGSSEEANRLRQLKTKSEAKLQTAENFLTMKESERAMLEAEIKSRIDIISDHPFIPGAQPHKEPMSEAQKKMVTEINEKLRQLLKNDKELASHYRDFQEAKETNNSLKQKIESTGGETTLQVSGADVSTEIDTVHQMAKMTVGRQGNHFPIFTREYFHCLPKETGFRENIIDIMTWIESIDPTAYCRVHKNVQNRIIPFVILIPTYGEFGVCWEPFSRYNRVTSRARIAIPMYSKNLKNSLLMATADLRWQVAKEKASYYWMEEGITGQYYQWFVSQKLKGDIKDYFVKDYLLWMTKESEGVQKLEKEIRGIFWRHMPFSQELKDKLKTRSLTYQELYQKDLNRAMSDGY